MTLIARVTELLASRREPAPHGDELAAARALGYSRRADHPWGVPPGLNQQRPSAGDPGGACGERVFEGATDFT